VSVPRLVLVRHGVTDWNREGRFQGHLDPPLSDAGRHEAALVAARLAADAVFRPARVISSSLGRALETAEAIGSAAGVRVEPEPRLIEIGQGDWEGRTHAELEASDADRYRAWRTSDGIRQPPGGEPVEEAAARVRAVLHDTLRGDRWPACLVSHGGTLRILAHALFGPPGSSLALDVDNASISAVERRGEAWHVVRWNDALHLLGIETTHVDEAEGRPLAL
jgi:glucosyl-3-phosphoglycerate phosphatase